MLHACVLTCVPLGVCVLGISADQLLTFRQNSHCRTQHVPVATVDALYPIMLVPWCSTLQVLRDSRIYFQSLETHYWLY